MTRERKGVLWVGTCDRNGPTWGIPTLQILPGMRAMLGGARALRAAGTEVALVNASSAQNLRWIIAAITLGGVRAALLFPEDGEPTIPAWDRRFHRYVVRDQDQARRWSRAGVALGRIVVVDGAHSETALDALLCEVGSMSRPPDRTRNTVSR